MQLGQPTARKPPFNFSAYTRVGFSDTDAQGIVYYGRYLPYFDHARVEYHRHLGLLDQETGDPEFVMRACHVVYEAPARFDDLLEVFTRTSRIGRTSATAEFSAYRVDDEALMCTAQHTSSSTWPSGGRRRSRTPTAEPSRTSKARPRARRRGMSTGPDTYRSALEAVDRIVNRESEADEVLRQVVEVVHDRFEHYSWVGIYLVEGDDLVLGPWKARRRPSIRIPVGQGICGAAAATGRTEVVDDVAADARYLACFPSTRSGSSSQSSTRAA